MKYVVIKDSGEGRPSGRHQVGSAVKTVAKAYALRQRMKNLQPPGSSASFTIQRAR